MYFIILVYIAALTLETLGSYISVVGLAAKTGGVLILIAITLDFSKIMIASVLYKRWKDLHKLLRYILVPVLVFLVIVTSTGTYAYLMQEFGKTTASTEQQKVQIDNLQKEKEKLESRKQAIDNQISQLPPESVNQRKKLTELFSKESVYINERLMTLDKELPEAQIKIMKDGGHSGTLGSIASAYNVSPEQVSRVVAFFIVLVIDPLAIVLLTVANFLVEQRKKDLIKNKDNISTGNPWDRFKENLFGNKTKISMFNKSFIHPYTDSTGHLIKQKVTLSPKSFIQNIDLIADVIAPIEYEISVPYYHQIIKEYIIKKPVLMKEKHHLRTSRMIRNISEFEPIIESVFPQTNKCLLLYSDILQEVKTQQKTNKDNIILSKKEFISDLSIVNDLPILISSPPTQVKTIGFFKDVLILQKDTFIDTPNTLKLGDYFKDSLEEKHHKPIDNTNYNEKEIIEGMLLTDLLDDFPKKTLFKDNLIIESEIIEDTSNNLIRSIEKPKPQTLPLYNNLHNQGGGFFENQESKKYIASNYHEDDDNLSGAYYDQEIVFWENDNDNFDLPLRSVLLHSVQDSF